jgi:hypothetical protein
VRERGGQKGDSEFHAFSLDASGSIAVSVPEFRAGGEASDSGNIAHRFGVEVSVSASAPPVVCLWLLRAAAWLAPADGRAEWNARWSGRLWNLWVLINRGELAGHAPVETTRLCSDAIAAAFWMRFNRATVRRWLRGPASILTAGAAALAALAIVSRGFTALRHVIYTAIEWSIDPRQLKNDPRLNMLIGHGAAVAMALLVGATLVLICGRMLGRCGWKYWMFLAAKLLLLALLLPLAWIEGGGFVRAHTGPGVLRLWLTLTSTLGFFGLFGCCVIWVFADQRCRCPVCLGRLALPVTFGSWASVFEPVTTEMVCDEGHGAMCVAESEMSGDDRWIELDASWKEF